MEIKKYNYFYIKTNKDWNYENKVKYGVTNDLYTRLINNSEHSTCLLYTSDAADDIL
jgi:hypothetical protein